jgi:hypothetical protein
MFLDYAHLNPHLEHCYTVQDTAQYQRLFSTLGLWKVGTKLITCVDAHAFHQMSAKSTGSRPMVSLRSPSFADSSVSITVLVHPGINH